MADAARSSRSGSSVVERALDVLLALIDAPDVGVTELSRQLGWPKSVTHRVLTSLGTRGFVSPDPETRRYRLGPAALRLGLAALSRADLHRLAIPHLRSLRDQTGETATLTVLSDNERVYIDQVESPHPVRQTIEVGTRAPLYVGASSKAMLAFLPLARREAIVARADGSYRADGSRITAAALRDELALISRRGFAISLGERVHGAASVASPVFDRRGEVVGSMSIAGVAFRQDATALERLGPAVRDEARRLSAELGWGSPERADGDEGAAE